MKQIIIAITMLFALASTMQVTAQKHRHSANPTAVAPANTTVTATPANAAAGAAVDTTGVEAFSDTTNVADNDSTYSSYGHSSSYSVNVTTPMDHILNSIEWNDLAGMFMVICVVIILFLLAPVLIIAAIFYFINKSRKDKLKLAQMAIQNGQPVPEHLIRETPIATNNNIRGGITQVFLGIGLMVFLGMLLGKLGFGIGALVFFIGLGKLVISLIDKQSEKNNYTYKPRQTPPPVNPETPSTSSTATPSTSSATPETKSNE